MHVFRQYNSTVDIEGVRDFNLADDLSQKINMPDQQIIVLPLPQVDSEQPCSSRTIGSAVVRHRIVFLDMIDGAIHNSIAPYACYRNA